MSSVKTVLIEMLSTFDAKSRLSAKQLKDQLHTCWPVPNSRVALDQLQKELRDEMKQSLEVVSCLKVISSLCVLEYKNIGLIFFTMLELYVYKLCLHNIIVLYFLPLVCTLFIRLCVNML